MDQPPIAKNSPGTRILGTVFLCLFALPFAGFGTFALVRGIVFLLTPGKVKEGLMLETFGLVFSLIGYGLFLGSIAGYREEQRKLARRAAHPGEPWLWRRDWAQGVAYASNRTVMWFAWIIAALWNGISTTLVVSMLTSRKPLNLGAFIGLIFPIIGIVILVWAIRTTLVWKKFGRSTFKMLSVPGVIGGKLEGAIETAVKVRPQDGFHLMLACVKRVRVGSGKQSSTMETVLWQTEKTMDNDLLDDPGRSGIPVSFQIPPDVKASDDTNPGDAIVWRLIAQAKLPGVNYAAIFEVPVFNASVRSNEQ